jgi:hypothetical protein
VQVIQVRCGDPERVHLHGVRVLVLSKDHIALDVHSLYEDDYLLDAQVDQLVQEREVALS